MAKSKPILSLNQKNKTSAIENNTPIKKILSTKKKETKVVSTVESIEAYKPNKSSSKSAEDTVMSEKNYLLEKDKTKNKSLPDIFHSIYYPGTNKGGKDKPVKFILEQKNAIKALRSDALDKKNVDLEKLSNRISIVDTNYDLLLQIILAASSCEKLTRNTLLELSVKIISNNWEGKYRDSDNV